MPFQIHALEAQQFAPLFALSDAELFERSARRVTVDANPGFPCRVSLTDAALGETVILLNFNHLTGATPYAASHAIHVREGAVQAKPQRGEVPLVLSRRLLSVRGFGADQMMIAADVIEGAELAARLPIMFADPAIMFVDIHNARQGCFAARATRD